MSVLVEPGHKTQYPLNHARILYRNVITSVSADSAQLNSPASAALTKTTYERWKPTTSGDSITGTFTEQVINSIAIAAHSNLTPTIEVRVNGSWEEIKAFPPDGESLILDFANNEYRELRYSPDNESLLLLIKPRLCDGVRVTAEFSDNAPSIGVLMAGTVLEMARPVYGGHSPAMLSSSSTVRPNVSESGEWLGASLIRQGRTVGINWGNLPAKWVRQKWHPFSEALKTSPYVFAWNPLRASADAIYCSSSDVPQPSNSGTRDLMSVRLSARGYSDGTEPVVLPTAEIDLLDAVTFTRASPAWGYNANGDLVEYATNEPRIVYDPVTLDRVGLLIEEKRTRLNTVAAAPTSPENVTVTATAHTVSFFGTGTIDLTGVATETLVGTGADDRVTLTFTPTAGTLTITPSGTVTDLQLEEGSFATSVIRGEGSQVTREADNASVDDLSRWFNAVSGTYFVSVRPLTVSGTGADTNKLFTIGDGSTENRIEISIDDSRSRFVLNKDGQSGTDVKPFDPVSANDDYRLAVSVDGLSGVVIFAQNGQSSTLATTSRLYDFSGVSGLYAAIGNATAIGISDRISSGTHRGAKAIPHALSAAELKKLTAPEQ